jgi:hypothetical protein
MQILNLSYWPGPTLPGHELLHKSILDFNREGPGKVLTEVANFNPSLIIEREYNDDKALYEPVYRVFSDRPRLWWWIDSHVNYKQRIEYAKNFTHLFVAVSTNIERIKRDVGHDRVYWLPLCWPLNFNQIIPNTEKKEFEVSFIGRWKPEWYFTERFACVERLKKEYGNRTLIVTDYENMLSLVRRSKVNINYSVKGDLNFRVFETLGCGTELVTDVVPNLGNLSGLAERVSSFVSLDQMIEAIDRVLYGGVEHDLVATQDWIRKNHSIENRYMEMIAKIYETEAILD